MTNTEYFTTPIYYVNDVPHIGHAYCTIATDVLSRYHRLLGNDVLFCTGTDEHGQKIEKTAEENGETPKELTDRVVKRFKQAWKDLDIANDIFIRTTEERHKKVVQALFMKLYEKGDIYLGEYEGMYCRPCESFYTTTQLEEGKCPECKREVEKLKEESFFFKMSKYEDKLKELFQKNPGFVYPETRKNEVTSFINEGLKDISISRTTVEWGIPVPPLGDKETAEQHYIYVWFDALINYLTALNYKQEGDITEKYFPNAIHVVGKDIIKFHAIIWPTMLMAADIPLPKQIVAHGFIYKSGEKMSKSKGNVIDPYMLTEDFGVDPLRYFLLREFSFGQDGNFAYESMEQRYNSELANDLGNLLNRSLNMVKKYYESKIPEANEDVMSPEARELKSMAQDLKEKAKLSIEAYSFAGVFDTIWATVRRANKFIEESAPWVLKKEEKDKELASVMYTLIEAIRIIAIYVAPIMPGSAQKMWDQLKIEADITKANADKDGQWGLLKAGHELGTAEPIFPRRQ